MTAATHRLRPFVAADTMALRDLFAQSIEVLTAEDYTEDQRLAWAATAEDAEAFADRLAGMLTLVVMVEGEYAGFGSLRDSSVVEMLYVHPYHVRLGVGTALMEAFERLAAARVRSRSMPARPPHRSSRIAAMSPRGAMS